MPWTSHSMSHLKFKMPFDLSFLHSFSYLSWILWLFEIILSNISHLEDPKVKRRYILSPELHIACHVWNLICYLIFLFPIPFHIYHEFHDYLRIFFQIQVIWRTLKSKEGIYGALNFTWHVTFEIWNTFWSYFLPFLIIFFHKGNDYLNFFFQIQVLWRTLNSKEGIYGSLNFS